MIEAMGPNFFLIVLGIMILLAVTDLTVGVANDAVNFLASAVGSKASTFKVALIVASFGILLGVTFSTGMMEVARKGIFHPEYFTMPEIMFLFLGVMVTDVFLLDLFNTFGLPTSTTVSVVFELLGAATAISLFKIIGNGHELVTLGEYINTSKVSAIILSILLSVVLAFITASIVQFFTRLIFTFDFQKRLLKFGAIWSAFAMAFIVYFILIKGAKEASFMTKEYSLYIREHTFLILSMVFAFFAVIFQILFFLKVNVLRFVVLAGTFALAMAFAANDLVNFIGVPLSAFSAFNLSKLAPDPMNTLMVILKTHDIRYDTWIFVMAGFIMSVTLWFSKKGRRVSGTAISLGRQHEGIEKFEPLGISRVIVRMSISFGNLIRSFMPLSLQNWIIKRMEPTEGMRRLASEDDQDAASFDLLRASVNLMVASALISVGTSFKLPLSTTFVTFMVGMGTSFADQAWGRESAVYRVTGVITVVSSWFVTAFMAFTIAFIFASTIFNFKIVGIGIVFSILLFSLWRNNKTNKAKEKFEEDIKIFNLKKVISPSSAINTTFEHLSILLDDIHHTLGNVFDALFNEQLKVLDVHKKEVKKIQWWTNVIMANVFKSIRIMQIKGYTPPLRYAEIVTRLQRISDTHRDIILRSYVHVANNHKGLLPEQVEELKEIRDMTLKMIQDVSLALKNGGSIGKEAVLASESKIEDFSIKLNSRQLPRIVNHTSKTRLSILYYSLIGDCIALARQNKKLIDILESTFNDF